MKFFLGLILLELTAGSRINSFDILNEQEVSLNKDLYEIIPENQLSSIGQSKCYLSIKTNQVHCFSQNPSFPTSSIEKLKK